MALLSLETFEKRALAPLLEYASLACLSPMFDDQWVSHGYLDQAMDLVAAWARQRALAELDVVVHRLEGRTPLLAVTVGATGPATTTTTTVLYGHLDKQPPLGEWSDGLGPFTPVRRANRLYARGVADDGYAAFAALLALESLEENGVPHGRCVVLIEASEESSSPDLDAYLDLLADHLGTVGLMICLDSGALSYDRLWVTTSLRGVVNIELTVRVLERGVHSGTASGVVPSSFRILRELLDRVEDAATGEILIAQCHAPIPEAHVRAARAVTAEFGDVVADELPVVTGLTLMGELPEDRLIRRTWHPALSVVGMGGIPEPAIAGNVLRPSTSAVLSLRLAPGADASEATRALTETLTRDVPSHAHVEVVAHSGSGWVAPPTAPWLAAALDAGSRDAFGHAPGFAGEGGSIPFLASLGARYPDVQFVATGVLGPESNAHGIDEMLDLDATVRVINAVATVVAAAYEHERANS